MVKRGELEKNKSQYLGKNGVLNNDLGISDIDSLQKVERMITTKRLIELYMQGISGDFDVSHYFSIHKYLFNGIYPFAGETRNVDISKSYTFCRPQFIYSSLVDVLNKAKVRVISISNREELLEFIVELYADLDFIHPFREGNGRCEREFIRQYLDYIYLKNGLGPYYLDYDSISDRNLYVRAVVMASFWGKTGDLYNLFDSILLKKDRREIKHR